MDGATLAFFAGCPEALATYAALEARVLAECAPATVRVQRTQITFDGPRLFACASVRRVERQARLIVTFGLGYRLDSPRVKWIAEPRPGRCTLHVVVSSPEEIDGELMAWIMESRAFAMRPRGRGKG